MAEGELGRRVRARWNCATLSHNALGVFFTIALIYVIFVKRQHQFLRTVLTLRETALYAFFLQIVDIKCSK